jgi:basic amino acid/polyamine antiporter, APA family
MGQTTASRPDVAPVVAHGDAALERAIGFGGATLLIIGNVIGSAIFLTSGTMAAELNSATALLTSWMAGGLLALAGGLTFAELGAMFPRSGGLYVFLKEAYGPLPAFLFGWSALFVILTGASSAVAVGFAEYFSYFVPSLSRERVVLAIPAAHLTITAAGVVAAASLGVVATINYVGVAAAARLQGALTVIKVAGLAAIPVLALVIHPASPSLSPVMPAVSSPASAFGVAMIAVLWAFDGWYALPFSAGEIRDPGRVIPRALVAGIGILCVIYLAVNVGYLYALDIPGMRGEVRIAERAMTALVGSWGAWFMAMIVCLSTFGNNIAGVLFASRAAFAMASDGLLFSRIAAVHPRYRTPNVAIILTTGWSATLALTGTYDQLFTYVVFAMVLFNMLGGLAIFRLRRTHPHTPRPYRTWGYPWVPVAFVASSLLLVANTLLERPFEALLGLGFVALGLPMFFYFRARARPSSFHDNAMTDNRDDAAER